MGIHFNDKTINSRLNRQLELAQRQEQDALSRLSTGSQFASSDPRPTDRAIAEKMEYRLRSLSSSKRNINDAISLIQTAESSMSEVSNIITRMKEINIAAASTTVSNQERRYLLVEYEGLHDEVNRISLTTEFNGIPLLTSTSERKPETMIFRLDDPFLADGANRDMGDVNELKLEEFRSVDTSTGALGLKSAKDILADSSLEEGIALEDVEEMLLPDDDELFATVYDQAIANLSTQRAVFGALQNRMERSLDFIDVYQENIAAAKSKIADTDYAVETSNLLQARIKMQANTSLLAQSQSDAGQALKLLNMI